MLIARSHCLANFTNFWWWASEIKSAVNYEVHCCDITFLHCLQVYDVCLCVGELELKLKMTHHITFPQSVSKANLHLLISAHLFSFDCIGTPLICVSCFNNFTSCVSKTHLIWGHHVLHVYSCSCRPSHFRPTCMTSVAAATSTNFKNTQTQCSAWPSTQPHQRYRTFFNLCLFCHFFYLATQLWCIEWDHHLTEPKGFCHIFLNIPAAVHQKNILFKLIICF